MPNRAMAAWICSSATWWCSALGTTTCTLMATMPLVTVQTWRSCTELTPGTAAMAVRTASSEMCGGTASSRTSTDSRTRAHAPRTMKSVMTMDATGSATVQPL